MTEPNGDWDREAYDNFWAMVDELPEDMREDEDVLVYVRAVALASVEVRFSWGRGVDPQ
jgi:hypothetical protein